MYAIHLLFFAQTLPVKLISTSREPSSRPKVAVNSGYLSAKLRWINLHGFSSEHLPEDFNVHGAVAIDLKHSLLRFVWKEPQVLL